MSLAAKDDVAHFESAFREKLKNSLGDIELERIPRTSGQWQCSYRGEEFIVSIRTEVLGASLTEAFEFLSELKSEARTARSTLLGESAHWMRKLSRGSDKTEFLDACRCAPCDRVKKQAGREWEDDSMCDFCEKPESSALLAGKHRCHVAATFRCSECRAQWSSVQARFDPEDERVLGQKCKACQQSGDLLRWNFCDVPDRGDEGARERKPHRSDLCEACGSFGNCQGAFFEPFIMSSAIALLTKQSSTYWATSGDVLVANAGRHSVAMLPHVFSGLDGENDSSWGSKSVGKGKAKGKNGQQAIGYGGEADGHGGGEGCFKCGEFGHKARDCHVGGGRGKGSNGGKGTSKSNSNSKGKGKGKGGRGCHNRKAENRDRCHW